MEADFTGARAPQVLLRGSGQIAASGIDADNLNATVEGSGSITIIDVSIGEVVSTVDGSGSITVSGTAEQLQTELRGGGTFHGFDCAAVNADIAIEGSAAAEVAARKTLDVSIAGSGTVTFDGQATVTQTIDGSGSVKKRSS